MKLKLLLLALFPGLGLSSLFAQTITPLAGYEQLRRVQTERAPAAKVDCGDFALEGITRILAGENLELKVPLDTFDLGPGVTYNCEGCDAADFGVATLRNDTLDYGADAGAEQGLDTLVITPCNAEGTCNDPATIIVLVQRAGRTIQRGDRLIDPSSSIDVTVPEDELPGGAVCRSIDVCPDTDYPGRDREFFFLNAQSSNNTFRYRSARYAGRNAVCVTLCNELGLCDVYRTTFTINRPNVELPFFDDFSYDDVRPAADLWQDIDVLINRNFADDPPSVGVATFDAVDFDGQPYSDENGSRTPVFRDFLTSAPIALQGFSTVGLSFYVQPRGFGNRPERQDSLLVQFLDRDGNWNTVLGLGGISETVGNGTPLPFTGQTVEVATEYLYDGFQFRFAAKSSERGAVDMWHVDYVKLDDDQTFLNTQDLALVEPPDFLLKDYTSMPIRHLRAAGDGLLADSLRIVLRNLSAGTTINISGGPANIFPPGQFVPARYTVDIINILGTNSVAPGELRDGDLAYRQNTENFQNLRDYLFDEVAEDASLSMRVEYDYFSDNQENGYADGALLGNDKISRRTYFDEYIAYDDGTAEGLLQVASGTVVLQEYTAFAEDELTGVSIRLPRGLNSVGNQDLRLVVYAGDTIPTDLIYEEDFPVLYPEDFFSDSLQGFTTYLFDEIIDLPKGEKFYVGWEQQSANNSIGVGYDRNQQPRDVQWFRTGSSWQRLTGSTTGAIMIRPLLSGFGGFATNTDDPAPEATALVEVYPNPTNGTLHLRPRPGHDLLGMQYRLFSANGALLQGGVTRTTVELGDLPAGLYLLEVSDEKVRSHHKIIRR